MDRDFKIEVGLTPHFHDSKNLPYYWTLFCFYENWCNEGTGWSRSPEEAWDAALKYFQKLKSSKNT